MENEKIIANPLSNADIANMPKDLFKEVPDRKDLHDQAFETKPVSFLRDSLNRFAKNKASIVAAVIILIIALYAIIVPFVTPTAHVSGPDYTEGFKDTEFSNVLPYCSWFKGSGFWDGTKTISVSENDYKTLQYDDSNYSYFVKLEDKKETSVTIGSVTKTSTIYNIRIDTYAVGNKEVSLTKEEYENLKANDVERKKQGLSSIIKPSVDVETYLTSYKEELEADTTIDDSIVSTIITNMRNYYNQNKRVYYKITAKTSDGKYNSNIFSPVFGEDGKPISIYKTNADGSYAEPTESGGRYKTRVDYYDYFTWKNGFEPRFVFGTNGTGQDIFLRLAKGTRFSLLLGVGISLINFIIGLIWGAISGYYGGYVDLTMERITDIISNIPSIIILTICSVQFNNNPNLKAAIGQSGVIVLAFLIAFVYSGWIGVAGTTRMQFYRFKGQEYVLASRTLGAKDARLIFRHILPNAIGTLVTSSVLMIPGVIFSESTLSFLGIVDFRSSNLASIGTLLSEGQAAGLQNNPHVLLFPCVIISLLMICFNLFGNGLRDAFNTSLKGAED